MSSGCRRAAGVGHLHQSARIRAEDENSLRTPRTATPLCWHITDNLRRSSRSVDFPELSAVRKRDEAAVRRPEHEARPAQIDVAQRTCFAGVERTNPEDELEPSPVWCMRSDDRLARRLPLEQSLPAAQLESGQVACQPRLTKVASCQTGYRDGGNGSGNPASPRPPDQDAT